MKYTIEILISNQTGALHRVTGLYAKLGLNIIGLRFENTPLPAVAAISVVSEGSEYDRSQIVKRLNNLYDVKEVIRFLAAYTASRDLTYSFFSAPE